MTTKKGEHGCVLYMGTFLPRECGIATFTKDLISAMDKKFNPSLKSEVLAMNDENSAYDYGDKVSFQINQGRTEDYLKTARRINERDDIKILNIQHEFGIFGGSYGEHLILFLNAVNKPIVVTLHTVIPHPNDTMKEVMRSIVKKSSAVVVMARGAKKILKEHYCIEEQSKIYHVHHGVPQVRFSNEEAKSNMGLANKTILSTFGLLNRGKGIEYAIKALPPIVKKFPNTVYLVIGETHPQVRKKEGESYRKELVDLVDELGLRKNVMFLNRYMTLDEITTYLGATDIYISPALDGNQIVSGTLSYALGSGKAIVSTSTAYAREVLTENRGILVDFRSPDGIRDAILTLMSDKGLREEMEKNAYRLGRKMIWPNVASSYLRVFNKVVGLREDVVRKFPSIKLDHLVSMTDHVGIIHHAKHSIPNRKTGYTLDDNARALIVAIKHYNIFKSQQSLGLVKTYISYLHYMQKDDGSFHNLMDYERKFLDKRGSEDSFGRTLMACGSVVDSAAPSNVRATAKFVFDNAVRAVDKLRHLRSKAFSIIGLHHYYKKYRHEDIRDKSRKLADSFLESYSKNSTRDWKWFEPHFTYSNGRLPECLFLAYLMTEDRRYLDVAKESLDFLSKILIADGKLILIGNQGWYYKGSKRARYDQQPVDAASMVETYMTAYMITKKESYYSNAILAFNWFLGKNTLNQMVYDEVTGGCFDGLSSKSINLNQGAESTISYLLARLNLEESKLVR